ncbi:hypothetical protein AMS68_006055 [Peltaster fructicola]|uniref:Spo7-like protein n=1 Tax=Peltaster fructicola TaxID=286661 RepID=A0A6H0Y117_9PEZI|nr:hypothetical protein AMS68_006055 [Peltaster fructicola]
MSDSRLDQLVKGAPPPDVSPTQVAASAKASTHHTTITAPVAPNASQQHDPRDVLPSSPPQIYLNLLILEASLRLQYLNLRARLRSHMVLLLILTAWILTFTYLLYFRPREDGSGVGGSVYWVLETTYKFAWGIGVVTACLFYATGMYERGLRWPRKFIGTTNRGLRPFNLKVVITRDSFIHEMFSWTSAGWIGESKRVNFQVLPRDIEAHGAKEQWNAQAKAHGLIEEDIAPAGDVLRILLLPKPFSPDFREGWDNFRAEFWERENARRAELRKIVKTRHREVARRDGGWLWWTGWRGWHNATIFTHKTRRQQDLEKLALREHGLAAKQHRRRESTLRADSQSRSSSGSTTPTPDPEGRHSRRGSESTNHVRRGSSGSATGSIRRARRTTAGVGSRLSATETLLQGQDILPLTKRVSDLTTTEPKKESPPSSPRMSPTYPPDIKREPDEG